jgi:ComF family protein
MRETVLGLKWRPYVPARLRDGLRQTFAALPESGLITSIIPVPLHPARLAERGFNQAEVIARELVSLTGLRLNSTALIRVKKTERHRAGMGARERARSLENAFRVRAPRLVEDRVTLLVDDVMTTGSTASETARALLEGGARAVNVLTLARAMNEFSN